MYRHCIYCSAELGANDALEPFPVGRTVAFDGEKGRLWAVCRRCARWNLAPIEERWEAIDHAERAFRDARLRVQGENVGLAKLRDGTRLVRIGAAAAREVAAWRYGTELAGRRRRRDWRETAANAAIGAGALGVAAGGTALAFTLFPALMTVGLGATGMVAAWAALMRSADLPEAVARSLSAYGDALAERRPVLALPAGASPTGAPIVLRRGHLRGAWLRPGEGGDTVLAVPAAEAKPARLPGTGLEALRHPVEVTGGAALGAVGRALVGINDRGATRKTLDLVLAQLGPSPDAYLRAATGRGMTLGLPAADVDGYWEARAEAEGIAPERRYAWRSAARRGVAGESHGGIVLGLALEMALHAEQERRAMEGELSLLESAWREAEEIAAIADRLAGESARLASGGGEPSSGL